jgi:alpha-tubulin suppressor-like RCC1 family protein
MRTHLLRTVGTLVLTGMAIGCREDAELPSAPDIKPSPAVSPTTALVFRQVSAGGSHNCGITTDSHLYCWGLNYGGALGIGTFGGPEVVSPVPVASPFRFRSVSAGVEFTCAVTVFDALYCWGRNEEGQLGNGTTVPSAVPVRAATQTRIREVSSGSHHACAVNVGDIAYCWGRNDHGQVGDATTAQRSVPTRPFGWAHFSTISAGDEFTCGVTTTNAVTPPRRAYCWGAFSQGHYGDQTTHATTRRPQPVPGAVEFDSVKAGLTHVCGISPTHRAYCWGADHGWLGSPSSGSNFQSTPRLVSGGRAFRSVDAGTYRSCGVTVHDVAFCWGLGVVNGTPVESPLPMRVGGDLLFRQLEAGGSFACGVTTGGKIYC